jgi:hypothetical protein
VKIRIVVLKAHTSANKNGPPQLPNFIWKWRAASSPKAL